MNPPSTSTSASPALHHPPYIPPGPPPAYQHAAQAAATASAALSQEHTPTPNHVAAGNGRKRKPAGAPGSRSVSSLTPDQLAKKRANDREAQRAIRERTRNTIESLENRIRELESQQPFQDLQRVIQERDRALAECEELRRRLAAVAGIVGAGQQPGLNELATVTAQQSPLPSVPQQQQQQTYQATHLQPPQQGQQASYEQPHIHPDLRSPGSATAQPSPTSQTTTPGAQHGAENAASRRWSPNLGQPSNTHGHQQYHSAPPPVQSAGDRLGLNFLLESSHQQHGTSSSPSNHSHHSPVAQDQPLYARLTNIGPPSCPLDALLIDFEKSRRKLLREGVSEYEVIGPTYPAFDSMLNPDAHPRPHPVSALLIDILSKFPDISKLAEKVAVLHIMFLVLRWEISPTAENYNALPPWCRPVAEQLDRPHVQWCDYLPWPHMRRQLAIAEQVVDFEDFFVPYTTTLSLNWPLPQDCVLISQPSRNADEPPGLAMNPAFEYHLRNLENWSLGSKFRNTFPHLVDESVRIKDV